MEIHESGDEKMFRLLVQVAMFGALLSNKKLREHVPPELFSDPRFRGAVEELRNGSQDGSYYCTWRLLEVLLCVEKGDGKKPTPLGRLHERMVIDSNLSRIIEHLKSCAETHTQLDDEGRRKLTAGLRNAAKV